MKKLALIVTEACNMRCKYCFEQHMGYQSKWMSEETIDRAVEVFFDPKFDNSDKAIELFGGEPLMCKKTLRYICNTIASKKPIKKPVLKITSNFLSVDDEVISILKSSGCRVELTASVLFDREMHDSDRIDVAGKPTYNKIISNILNVVNNHKDIHIRCHSVFSPAVIESPRFKEIVQNSTNFMKDHNVKVSVAPISGGTDETEYTFECITKLVNTINDHTIEEEEFFGGLKIDDNGDYLGHFNSKTRAYELFNKTFFCADMQDTIVVMTDGGTTLCHRMGLSGEMAYEPVASIHDSLDEIITKHTGKLEGFKKEIASEFVDGVGELFEVTSEHGYACAECIAYHECHHCFIPMKGNIKNIKPKEICDYAMRMGYAKMTWELNHASEDIGSAIPYYIEHFTKYMNSSDETDSELVKSINAKLTYIKERIKEISTDKKI